MTAADIDAAITKLEREISALPDPQDIAVPRQREQIEERLAMLQRVNGYAQTQRATRRKLRAQLDAAERWYRDISEWLPQLRDELAIAKPLRVHGRDAEQRVLGLELSIANLERGCEFWNGEVCIGPQLAERMRAAGYPTNEWPGSLVSVENQLAHLRKRLADSDDELETALRYVV
jgi:hypothetical protein